MELKSAATRVFKDLWLSFARLLGIWPHRNMPPVESPLAQPYTREGPRAGLLGACLHVTHIQSAPGQAAGGSA